MILKVAPILNLHPKTHNYVLGADGILRDPLLLVAATRFAVFTYSYIY